MSRFQAKNVVLKDGCDLAMYRAYASIVITGKAMAQTSTVHRTEDAEGCRSVCGLLVRSRRGHTTTYHRSASHRDNPFLSMMKGPRCRRCWK